MNKKKLFIIAGTVFLVLVVIIILILPKGKQKEAKITKIIMAKGETSNGEPVNPTDVFSINDSEIHAIITIGLLPANTTIEYRWYNINTKQTIQKSERESSADFFGNNTDSIKKSLDLNWDKGEYEFRIMLGEEILAKKEYFVRTPGEIEKTRILSSIKEINLTTAVDLRGNPTSAIKTIFSVNNESIYASVAHQDSPANTSFEARWIFQKDNRLIKSYKKTLSGDGVFAFSIDAKNDSWIPIKKWESGKYTLNVYLEGELVKEIPFTIQ